MPPVDGALAGVRRSGSPGYAPRPVLRIPTDSEVQGLDSGAAGGLHPLSLGRFFDAVAPSQEAYAGQFDSFASDAFWAGLRAANPPGPQSPGSVGQAARQSTPEAEPEAFTEGPDVVEPVFVEPVPDEAPGLGAGASRAAPPPADDTPDVEEVFYAPAPQARAFYAAAFELPDPPEAAIRAAFADYIVERFVEVFSELPTFSYRRPAHVHRQDVDPMVDLRRRVRRRVTGAGGRSSGRGRTIHDEDDWTPDMP